MRDMLMLETKPGSPNGAIVLTYEAGTVYSLPEALAEAFQAEGWAEPADPKKGAGGGAGDGAPDLAKMTKAQLADHAKEAFGAELDTGLKKDEMLAEISRLAAAAAGDGEGGDNA